MNPLKKSQQSELVRTALVSGVITSLFMYFVYYPGWISIWTGLFIGFFIHMSIAFYSMYVVNTYLRRVNLILVLLINTIVFFMIMVVVVIIGVGLFYMKGNFGQMFGNLENLFGYYYVIGYIFGFAMSIFFNFFAIINTLIGKSVLGKLFIGRYRNPFEVDRVFMFVDIKSSTSIAEKIGHKKFLSLVNDFFYDLSLPVSQSRGDIYKYVGDGAIVSWKMKDALKRVNCIRCFYDLQQRINKNQQTYLNKYGVVPQFKAGIHGGTVITGELGYTRREIAFMGDVMNTASRIEEACKTYNVELLVSESLLNKLDLPGEFSTRKVGNVILRGKSEEVGLITVEPI